MGAFEDFINANLPLRVVQYNPLNSGYDADPNNGAAPAQIKGAPRGAFYYNSTNQLYVKRTTAAGTWEAISGSGGFDGTTTTASFTEQVLTQGPSYMKMALLSEQAVSHTFEVDGATVSLNSSSYQPFIKFLEEPVKFNNLVDSYGSAVTLVESGSFLLAGGRSYLVDLHPVASMSFTGTPVPQDLWFELYDETNAEYVSGVFYVASHITDQGPNRTPRRAALGIITPTTDTTYQLRARKHVVWNNSTITSVTASVDAFMGTTTGSYMTICEIPSPHYFVVSNTGSQQRLGGTSGSVRLYPFDTTDLDRGSQLKYHLSGASPALSASRIEVKKGNTYWVALNSKTWQAGQNSGGAYYPQTSGAYDDEIEGTPPTSSIILVARDKNTNQLSQQQDVVGSQTKAGFNNNGGLGFIFSPTEFDFAETVISGGVLSENMLQGKSGHGHAFRINDGVDYAYLVRSGSTSALSTDDALGFNVAKSSRGIRTNLSGGFFLPGGKKYLIHANLDFDTADGSDWAGNGHLTNFKTSLRNAGTELPIVDARVINRSIGVSSSQHPQSKHESDYIDIISVPKEQEGVSYMEVEFFVEDYSGGNAAGNSIVMTDKSWVKIIELDNEAGYREQSILGEISIVGQTYTPRKVVVPVNATASIDCSLSNHFHIELTEDIELAEPVNFRDGGVYSVNFLQDSTGGHTVTFPNSFEQYMDTAVNPTASQGTLLVLLPRENEFTPSKDFQAYMFRQDGLKRLSPLFLADPTDGDWTKVGTKDLASPSQFNIVVGEQGDGTNHGQDVLLFVSGTETTGSATDKVAVFKGAVRMSASVSIRSGSNTVISHDRVRFEDSAIKNINDSFSFKDSLNDRVDLKTLWGFVPISGANQLFKRPNVFDNLYEPIGLYNLTLGTGPTSSIDFENIKKDTTGNNRNLTGSLTTGSLFTGYVKGLTCYGSSSQTTTASVGGGLYSSDNVYEITGALTIETLFYVEQNQASNDVKILAAYGAGTAGGTALGSSNLLYALGTYKNKPVFLQQSGSSAAFLGPHSITTTEGVINSVTGNVTLLPKHWHLLSVTRDDNQEVRFNVNGVYAGGSTLTGDANRGPSASLGSPVLSIGHIHQSASSYINDAPIQSVKIFDSVLTDAQLFAEAETVLGTTGSTKIYAGDGTITLPFNEASTSETTQSLGYFYFVSGTQLYADSSIFAGTLVGSGTMIVELFNRDDFSFASWSVTGNLESRPLGSQITVPSTDWFKLTYKITGSDTALFNGINLILSESNTGVIGFRSTEIIKSNFEAMDNQLVLYNPVSNFTIFAPSTSSVEPNQSFGVKNITTSSLPVTINGNGTPIENLNGTFETTVVLSESLVSMDWRYGSDKWLLN